MARRRIGRLVALVLAAPLVPLVASGPVTAGPAAAPPSAAHVVADDKALATLSLPGSSIVPVPPTVLFKGRATRARTVTVAGRAGLPSDGAGAAVVGVAGKGKVFLWASGAGKPGNATVAGPTGVAVVRLGAGGDLTVQGPGKVTVTLLGWLPETSDVLLVPDRRVLARKLRKGSSVAVKVTDPLAPADPSAVLLRLRVAKKEGAIGVGPYGSTVKVPTLTYGPQVRDTVTWVPLGPGGRVNVRKLTGASGRVEVDVLGWATSGALTAPTSSRIAAGKVKANKKKTVKVTGAAGTGAGWVRLTVPSPRRDGTLSVYGEGGPARATKLALTPGSAGTATALLRLPASGKVTLRSRSGETLRFSLDLVARLPRHPAEDTTRMVLPATTRLAGPSDVISSTGTTVTLRAGTDTPPVGGHLVIAPSSDARFAGLIGTVTGVAPGAGRVVVAYADAAIHEAFTDFDTAYHGGVSAAALQARPRAGDRARAAGLTDIVGIGIGNIGALECTASGIAFSALDFGFSGLYGDFTFDLGSRQAHFELGGTATATASAALSPGSVSCTLDHEFPGRIPAGWLGVGVHAGLTVSLSTAGTGTASYSASAPVTIGFDYDDGNVTNLSDLDFSGTGQLDVPETTLTVSPYVGLVIGFVKDLKLIDATVNVDLAANVVFGPHPRYVGDQCNAIRFAPTINISAGVDFAWFPDPSFSIAQIPLADIDLWRGPCLGYSGTVTFLVEEATTSSDAVSTTSVDSELTATVTSDPSRPVERTTGGGALNLGLNSSWSADYLRTQEYSYTVPGQECGYTITDDGSGGGAHATDDTGATRLFFDAGTYDGGPVRGVWNSFSQPAGGATSSDNITVTTTHTGGCGLPPTSSASATDFTIPGNPNLFSGVTVQPSGTITGTDSLVVDVGGGTVTYTITFALTAVDVPFT